MEDETLQYLILEKGFDKYTPELANRCDKEGIDFAHQFNTTTKGLTLWMNFGNIPATIEINITGDVTFIYFEGGSRREKKFRNFTPADFNMLVEHAFLFLRDGSFNNHSLWFMELEKE